MASQACIYACLAVLCVLFLAFPQGTHAYGTILADYVEPATEDVVRFESAKTDTADVQLFDAGQLSVSDPDGFQAVVPDVVNIDGGSIDFEGELGISLGSSGSDTSITAGGDISMLTQDLNFHANNINVTADDDMIIDSGRYTHVTAMEISMEGLFGFTVESDFSNVDVYSGVEIFSFSDELIFTADDTITFGSPIEVDITSSSYDIDFSGTRVNMYARENIELVSETDLNVNAEDAIISYTGSSIMTSLNDFSLISLSRNVDLGAADAMKVFADDINVSASDNFYINSVKDLNSEINFFTANAVNFNINQVMELNSKDIRLESVSAHTIDTTATTNFYADSQLHFGFEGTDGIDLLVSNDVTFQLNQGASDEWNMMARDYAGFLANDDFTVDAADDVKILAQNSQFLSGDDIRFTAGDIFASWNLHEEGVLYNLVFVDAVYEGGLELDIIGRSLYFEAGDDVLLTSDNYLADYHLAAYYDAGNDVELVVNQGNLDISGGNIYADVEDDIEIFGGVSAIFGSAAGTIEMYFDMDMDVSATSFIAVSSSFGDLHLFGAAQNANLLLQPSMDVNGGAIIVEVMDNARMMHYSSNPLSISAIQSASFGNLDGIEEDDPIMSFTFNGDILFATTSNNTMTADEFLFDGGFNIEINSDSNPLSLSVAGDLTFMTQSKQQASGISFSTKDGLGGIYVEATEDISIDSASDLTITSDYYEWHTGSFTVNGYDSVTVVSQDDLIISGTYSNLFTSDLDFDGIVNINSDNNMFFVSIDDQQWHAHDGQIWLTAGNDVEMRVKDDFVLIGVDSVQFYGGDITTAVFDTSSGSFDSGINFNAPSDGAVITISSQEDLNVLTSASDISIMADQYWSWSDSVTYSSSNGTFTINGDNVVWNAHALGVAADGNVNIVGSGPAGVSFGTEDFFGSLSSTSNEFTFEAQKLVLLTAEMDLNYINRWDGVFGNTTITTPDLLIVSDNSIDIKSDLNLDILAWDDMETSWINIMSGGNTMFKAMEDFYIDSANYATFTAGKSIEFASFLEDGYDIFSSLGHLLITSEKANAFFQASDLVNILVTNNDGSASVYFKSTVPKDSERPGGISMETDEGGILFDSFGFVNTSNVQYPSWAANSDIYIESTAVHGDVVFDSQRSMIVMEAPQRISYESTVGPIVTNVYSWANYTSILDMTFTAAAGEIDINGYRGITVNAGSNLNAYDLIFNTGNVFSATANDIIDIRSEGPIADGENAIEILSMDGTIRFVTATSGNITALAMDDHLFEGLSFLVDQATNDFYSATPSGSIIVVSEDKASFVTENGPLEMIAQTGSLGGAVSMTAQTGDITFDSGNWAMFTALEQIVLTAQTGISLFSADGRVEIAAEASTSNVNFFAGDGISITSTGTRVQPSDGVYFEASNNVEIGVVATTDTINFNSVNLFQIGSETRPIITLNAGGSTTTDGFTVNSVGGIFLQSNETVTVSPDGNFDVTAQIGAQSWSYGPFSIQSFGGAISLSSAKGILNMVGDNLKATDTASGPLSGVTAVSSGLFDIGTVGTHPNDHLIFQSQAITIESDTTTWTSRAADIDLTARYSMTTSGAGTFTGLSQAGSDSSIDFVAGNAGVTVSSNGDIEYTTMSSFGDLSFITTESSGQSDIMLTTKTGSDIEFTAGREAAFFSTGAGSFTSQSGGISIRAVDTNLNDDSSLGDISVLTTGNISASSARYSEWSGDSNVIIETTSTEADVGAPLSFFSTGEMTFDATNDIIIDQAYAEGGNMTFSALSDLTVSTTDANGELTLSSDWNLRNTAARDLTVDVDDDLFMTVYEDTEVTAYGKDPNENFGVHIISLEDEISFTSLFGSLDFSGNTGMQIQSLSSPSGSTSDLTFEVYHSAKIEGTTSTTLSMIDFTSNSHRGMVSMTGASGFSANAASVNIQTNGIDEDANWGARFATNNADLEINVTGDWDASGAQGTYMSAQWLDFTGEDVSLRSNEIGHILIESSTEMGFFSNEDIDIDSSQSIIVEAGDFILFDSDETFNVDSNAGGSVLFQTRGSMADVRSVAEGTMDIEGTTMKIRTSELQGSYVNITSDVGHIEIDASNFLNVYAGGGNLVITAPADDGDFYVDSNDDMIFYAAGDIAFTSVLSISPTDAMNLNFGPTTYDANALMMLSENSPLHISGTNFNLDASRDDDDSIGGDIILSSENTFTMDSNTITLTSNSYAGSVSVDSAFGDIRVVAGNGNSVNMRGSLSMKVPFNMDPSTGSYYNDPNLCRSGEMMIMDMLTLFPELNVYYGYYVPESLQAVCVCDPYAVGSGNSSGTGRLWCVMVRMPPCSIFQPYCPPFEDTYNSYP